MNTTEILQTGLRIFFLSAMTLSIKQGSLFAIVMCSIGFLTIEYFLEELIGNEAF
jgi:hypothetical protein